jgi:hypothetical protein
LLGVVERFGPVECGDGLLQLLDLVGHDL